MVAPRLLPQILHPRQRFDRPDSTTVHLRLLQCIHLSIPTLMLGLGPVLISVHHCAKIRMSDEMAADLILHTLMFCQAAVLVAALLL